MFEVVNKALETANKGLETNFKLILTHHRSEISLCRLTLEEAPLQALTLLPSKHAYGVDFIWLHFYPRFTRVELLSKDARNGVEKRLARHRRLAAPPPPRV